MDDLNQSTTKPKVGKMQLSQEELEMIELQELLNSMSDDLGQIEFSEDEIDDDFLELKQLSREQVKEAEEKEDRSPTRSSMNFASDVMTVEDYPPGPERVAFEALMKHCRNCFNARTSEKKRIESLMWVFVPNIGTITFDLCCEAMQIRANLIRTRIQYALYKEWIVLSQPIHFLMEPLPSSFEAEILYNHTENHLKIAKKIWSHPSIQTSAIVAFCREHNIDNPLKALDVLEEVGSIVNEMDHWYFVGRNPEAMGLTKRNNFNWCALNIY